MDFVVKVGKMLRYQRTICIAGNEGSGKHIVGRIGLIGNKVGLAIK